MDENGTLWLPSNMTGSTRTMDMIYVFTPAGILAKRTICILLSMIAILGFFGNYFILYFLWKRPVRNKIQSSRFVKNLNMYVKSLSLSEILSSTVSLPLMCIQMSFDVFQSGWECMIVRYVNFIFPVVTINNLVVISLEKYLSTRTAPRTFRVSTVRKMIICAWVLGISIMLIPTASFAGLRVDLNATHFTIVCKYDETFYPFKITLVLFPLQYFLPCAFVTYINMSLVRTVWIRTRKQIGSEPSNAFKAHLRNIKLKGTILLVALTFAFIIPNFFYTTNIAYTQLVKPQRDFSTDYIIRYASGGIAYLSGVINFIIYFSHMKAFRDFLKKRFCRMKDDGTRRLKTLIRDKKEKRVYAVAMSTLKAEEGQLNELELANWKQSSEIILNLDD